MAKILVVDDDPDFVEITRLILESNNYEVISAHNSADALDKMHKEKPDLVLLDIMMTQILDGLTVPREMLTDPDLERVPIIVVSSITSSPHIGEFPTDEYLAVDDWISKPVQPEVLLEKVKRYLKRFRREKNARQFVSESM
ncbi:MAG: response regulator [bacterium]